MKDLKEAWGSIQVGFKGQKVYALLANEAGELFLDENKRVPFSYQKGGKLYATYADRLAAIPGAVGEPFLGGEESALERASKPKEDKARAGTAKPLALKSEDRRFSGPSALAASGASSADLLRIYTDGACSGNPGPAGLGVHIQDGDKSHDFYEYLGRATNNIGELTAILRALEWALEHAKGRPLEIQTDSSYSIGVLTKNWKAKANQELIQEIKNKIRLLPNVHLKKVRGHAGDPGNERADALARRAVELRSSGKT